LDEVRVNLGSTCIIFAPLAFAFMIHFIAIG